MPLYSSPIAGVWYHPPSNGILKAAPENQPLTLHPDPFGENSGSRHDDPNAIMINLNPQTFPEPNRPKLSEELQGFGVTLEEFLLAPNWLLGFIPRGIAAMLDLPGPIPAQLRFDPNGKPLVVFTLDSRRVQNGN